MTKHIQSEAELELSLIKQLQGLEYEYIKLDTADHVLKNLQNQLAKHNNTSISDTEFERILQQLKKPKSVFESAKVLRDRVSIQDDEGETKYIQLFNQERWCANQFQVTSQITQEEGTYTNRYDVTILINGMPLVQIELKRRGLELKEAFNQINRYHKHSFWSGAGLFKYVQLFVISNGVNTKYYANNRKQSFAFTSYWADENNEHITQLKDFTESFLAPCHVSKMIAHHIVLNETFKSLMVLRPYQYYATEAIVNKVKNGYKTDEKNGYIWHTTGSGKTLTSFKASQLIMKMPEVERVLFVVDRNDLDYQTANEFNAFQEGSVDSTDNTKILVDQLTGTYVDKTQKHKGTKLIVTTIQKLNNAIKEGGRYAKQLAEVKDKRYVFIFDECHRSQFGATHKAIKAFFPNHQMFGFTGTPIFEENVSKNEFGKRTTKDLFDECLHRYLITDAISDHNVLKFSVEYVGKYKERSESKNDIDIEVEDIDTEELMTSEKRLYKIVDYIIHNHNAKTHGKKYSAIFCVSDQKTLIKYYELFKAKKEAGLHDLRIVTIFSYSANEEDEGANGMIAEESTDIQSNEYPHSREKLEEFIADYNAMYNKQYSTKDSKIFYNYYKDIAKRFKNREKESFEDKDRADILLVVNMFLTGFDAKKVNTLYVDKNLKYHGLIQAFSRTNRILDKEKSHGNIVCFRNLKEPTDKAVTLFSNPNANEEIVLKPYQEYISEFKACLERLKKIAPSIDSVNELKSESEKLEFVQAFRAIIRLKNVLGSFSDFSFDSLGMEEQEFEDYKSKYLDIYEETKNDHKKEKISILDDVDFELELIHRDEINADYILKLLRQLPTDDEKERDKQIKAIVDLLSSEAKLRSKRELIEKFIHENLPNIPKGESVEKAFLQFWGEQRQTAFYTLCEDEKLLEEKAEQLIEQYLFAKKKPLADQVVASLEKKPSLLQRSKTIERVNGKLFNFIETFYEGMGGVFRKVKRNAVSRYSNLD